MKNQPYFFVCPYKNRDLTNQRWWQSLKCYFFKPKSVSIELQSWPWDLFHFHARDTPFIQKSFGLFSLDVSKKLIFCVTSIESALFAISKKGSIFKTTPMMMLLRRPIKKRWCQYCQNAIKRTQRAEIIVCFFKRRCIYKWNQWAKLQC